MAAIVRTRSPPRARAARARQRRRGPTRRDRRRGTARERARAHQVSVSQTRDRPRHETGTCGERRCGHVITAQIRRATDAHADSVGARSRDEDIGDRQPVLARLTIGNGFDHAAQACHQRLEIAAMRIAPLRRRPRGPRSPWSASAATRSAAACRAARSARSAGRGGDRRCAPWRDRAARCCRTRLAQIRAEGRRRVDVSMSMAAMSCELPGERRRLPEMSERRHPRIGLPSQLGVPIRHRVRANSAILPSFSGPDGSWRARPFTLIWSTPHLRGSDRARTLPIGADRIKGAVTVSDYHPEQSGGPYRSRVVGKDAGH